jgi:amino acid transporter/nucleotide-binding universal stress UspA family protein
MKRLKAEVHLSREMTLTDATMIGVGAMIGAGIFVLTGIAAGIAGPALLVAFLLNGCVALLTAMSYAELGSCYHDAGGGYLWVKEGLPKWNGFLSGWMSWFAHAVACSLYALGFGAYFELVLKELGFAVRDIGILSPQKLLAVGVALIFAYVNYRGASETGKIGNLVTVTKILILGVFVAFGLSLILKRGDWVAALTPFAPHGWAGIIKAMGLTFIAFQGVEVISQCSEEVKDPKRNIPRAVFLSLAIVVPIYLLVAFTSLAAVNPGRLTPWDYLAEKKETALVEVARTFFSAGGVMLLFGGVISTMSALNATVYSSSRVAFAMGRDRNFPAAFGKVHRRRFTPHVAIFFSLVIVVFMSVSLPIEDVASAADIMFLLLFLQVNLTLIRLRKMRPDLDRGFRVPLVPWLSLLAIGLLLFLALYMVTYSPKGWLVTAAWIAAGLLIYRTYAFRREVEHVRVTEALERLERREYRILAPLSNPASVSSLLAIASAIAKKHDAEVILLHVVEVEEGLPLRAGLEREDEIEPIFEGAEDSLRQCGIPVRSMVRVSHRISQGILETAAEENCNFIILGREKQESFLERVYSSVVDSVIRESPCEVAILHGQLGDRVVRNLLIPFGENVHSLLAVEVAPALLQYWNCHTRVVVVLEPGTPPQIAEERLGKVRAAMLAAGLPAKLEMVTDKAVVEGILSQSRRADLVLMGGRNSDFLGLLFANSLTREITERVTCPVLWVKEYEEIPSFWESLFESESTEVEPKP